MNEYDSNRISDFTKKINYTLTNNLSEADCYILNTCHIREKATDKVYHDIGRLKKEFRNKLKPIVLVPETPSAHEARLTRAGFSEITEFFHCINFKAWMAVK